MTTTTTYGFELYRTPEGVITTRTTTLDRRVCERCHGRNQRRFEIADESPFCAGLVCSRCEAEVADERAAQARLDDARAQDAYRSRLRRLGEEIDEDEASAVQNECLCGDRDDAPLCTCCEWAY